MPIIENQKLDPTSEFIEEILLNENGTFMIEILGNHLLKAAVKQEAISEIIDVDDFYNMRELVRSKCSKLIKDRNIIRKVDKSEKRLEILLIFCEQLIFAIAEEYFKYKVELLLTLNQIEPNDFHSEKNKSKNDSPHLDENKHFDNNIFSSIPLNGSMLDSLKLTKTMDRLNKLLVDYKKNETSILAEKLLGTIQAEIKNITNRLYPSYSLKNLLKHNKGRVKTSDETTELDESFKKKMNRPVENEVAINIHRIMRSILNKDHYAQVAGITNIILDSQEYTAEIIRVTIKKNISLDKNS